MLSVATQYGMAFLGTHLVSPSVPYLDGVFVTKKDLGAALDPAWAPWLPECPVRVNLWSEASVGTNCPRCLQRHEHYGGRMIYYTLCPSCAAPEGPYVSLCFRRPMIEALAPYLSTMNHWYGYYAVGGYLHDGIDDS